MKCLFVLMWFGENHVDGGQGGRRDAAKVAEEDVVVRVGAKGVVAVEAEGEEAGG